ncbi:MAG: DPP IV N-terminal domain-containing protein [Prevotellaceae bacterium]|nr:DPP IV N-terminal domain-containing protein [Candidatus Minthosoma caballi]
MLFVLIRPKAVYLHNKITYYGKMWFQVQFKKTNNCYYKMKTTKILLHIIIYIWAANSFAQSLTLEDALNNWRTIPLAYPEETTWGDNGMPYEAFLSASGYICNSAGRWALIFHDTKKVWRYETRGAYTLIDTETQQKRELGKGLPASSLMFAKISPDGTKVAYVCNNNIYMEHCALNEQTPEQLTFDGCDSIVNGTFDWVYEEEFDCRDGFRWSADSKYIAYWQSNTSGTGTFDIIDNVNSLYPTIQRFPYPKAGTTNSAVRAGIIDIFGENRKQGGVATLELKEPTTQWIDIAGNDGTNRDMYLPRMEFVPGTNTLMIQQMNRQQNTNNVWTCEVVDGIGKNPHILITDKDKAWLETNDNIHWLKGNKSFTFTSERDGWRHIYRVSADGKKWDCLTKGNFDVIQEVAFDDKRGYIYFMSTEKNATQRYMYRTNVYGNGKVEKISGNNEGQYSYQISPNFEYALERFSNAATPPQFRKLKMNKSGKWEVAELLVDNHEAAEKFKSLGLSPKEFVKCKSGDLELDAWIIKPKDFDPSKKYPVIDYVYGEPASATVQDAWEQSLFWQYLAQQGYVIVSIENRGANSPRGREWRKCIYGEVGVAASEDQANGIQDLCRQFSWMDSERIGITGWSGGGSQTLNCMFRYPDVFKTGIAVAFVADQKLYDTIYQERYMDTPQNNPEGYKKGSPINFVNGLKGNLLLIHGTGDDNVHYQNCEALVNELIKHGKIFYQISYPMRTHSISEGRGTSLHLRKTMTDFWKQYLPAGAR